MTRSDMIQLAQTVFKTLYSNYQLSDDGTYECKVQVWCWRKTVISWNLAVLGAGQDTYQVEDNTVSLQLLHKHRSLCWTPGSERRLFFSIGYSRYDYK